jgi:hypothetical protein
MIFTQMGEKGLDSTAKGSIAQTLEILFNFGRETMVLIHQVVNPPWEVVYIYLFFLVNIPLQCSCFCSKVVNLSINSHKDLPFIPILLHPFGGAKPQPFGGGVEGFISNSIKAIIVKYP